MKRKFTLFRLLVFVCLWTCFVCKAQATHAPLVALSNRPPSYIIITNEELMPAFQVLADWKIQKGVPTLITTVENIETSFSGSDLPERIRKYIAYAIKQWGTNLYVLFGGDIDIVPSRFVKGITNKLLYPTDVYFGNFQGTWNNKAATFNPPKNYSADSIKIILGRLPVSSFAEASIYINKLIAYEKATDIGNPNYLRNTLYSTAYMAAYQGGGLYSFLQSQIEQFANEYSPEYISKKYICDNADCTGDPKRYTTKFADCPVCDKELNRQNFLAALNDGGSLGVGKFHIIYHTDHGGSQGIAASGKDKGDGVYKPDFDALSNGSSYQILLSNSCYSANFAFDCIGKHYIMNPNGGGVAYISNTDVGYTSEIGQLKAFFEAIYSTAKHPSIGRYDIGSAYLNALKKGGNSTKWRLHLLGEPEMQVWTDIPQRLNATISPTSLSVGKQTIEIKLSGLPADKEVKLCLQKVPELYYIDTLKGNETFSIPITVETTGSIKLTLSAHNFFLYEKDIAVTASNEANLCVSSLLFDDSISSETEGNGDGRNDAGETICLLVEVKNNGAKTAKNITTKLSSSSPYVELLSNSFHIPELNPGQSALVKLCYRIDKDAPAMIANTRNAESLGFVLTITDDIGKEWNKNFNVDVFNSEISQRSKKIANAVILPNDTVYLYVELQNTGSSNDVELKATLTSENSKDIIAWSSPLVGNYPLLNSHQTAKNTIPFLFVTGPAYNKDSILAFRLEVVNQYGKKWNHYFTLTPPVAPTGIDFESSDKEITISWEPAENVRYNIYRCNVNADDTESGEYKKLNNEPLDFSFYVDNDSLNILTKYYYKVTSVSNDGMESDGVRQLAWTSYANKYLYPITMDASIGKPYSSVNVADVNYDGYKEIFVVTRRPKGGWIVGLDYQGNELFDVDKNVTTYSGFAPLEHSGFALPALADIKRTGEYCVIVPTRDETATNENTLLSYAVVDDDKDAKPDLQWKSERNYQAVRGAVVANIDNSVDGSMETITTSAEGGNYIDVYNSNGEKQHTITFETQTYGALAVADLDGNGTKEIILGSGNGIYVWQHDGSNFITGQQPIYTIGDENYQFKSSVIVCDLDNDGTKEILTAALHKKSPYQGKIYAVKPNGKALDGWGKEEQTIPYANNWYCADISVGDLNNDTRLEVIAIGTNTVRIWKNNGELYNTIEVPGLMTMPETFVPILGDVDGDGKAEIIFGSATNNNIYAYKPDGSKALGFPLRAAGVSTFIPCIADVDNDGFNELISINSDEIQLWRTSGLASCVEWGRERHNQFNTGEYQKICEPIIVTKDTEWNEEKDCCGDIIVSAGTLTIGNKVKISMPVGSFLIVRTGAVLKIDRKHKLNDKVKVMSGGKVVFL